jgi:hypothetical protein
MEMVNGNSICSIIMVQLMNSFRNHCQTFRVKAGSFAGHFTFCRHNCVYCHHPQVNDELMQLLCDDNCKKDVTLL